MIFAHFRRRTLQMIDKQDDEADQVDCIRQPTNKEARRREAFNNQLGENKGYCKDEEQ
jgi:hypothetical protein